MKLAFIGDVCLARQILFKFENKESQIVNQTIINELKLSDYVIANLESPICDTAQTDGDHLSFKGSKDLLNQFKFVDYFSLSNNHINDCGEIGMKETISFLNEFEIGNNGLYNSFYTPLILKEGNEKIAVFTCTDMMNIPIPDECIFNTLHIDDNYIDELIKQYKKENYFVIIYAHVGILFSRFINPTIRKLLHEKIDVGADLIVTAHSHCLGGMEYYKGKPLFYSLGDFVMDGGSYRRRQAAFLNIEIINNQFESYKLNPTIINNELNTVFPPIDIKNKLIKQWEYVSEKIKQNSDKYEMFFKSQYKIEMFQHSLSTIKFLFKTKGIFGMFNLIVKRYEEVLRMGKWLSKDRSKDRRDDEAIKKDRKKFSTNDLYK